MLGSWVKKLNLFLSASNFHAVLDIWDVFSVLVLDFSFLFYSERVSIVFPEKPFTELTWHSFLYYINLVNENKEKKMLKWN